MLKPRITRRTVVSEFEGEKDKKKQVFSQSILTNWRETEREEYGEGK